MTDHNTDMKRFIAKQTNVYRKILACERAMIRAIKAQNNKVLRRAVAEQITETIHDNTIKVRITNNFIELAVVDRTYQLSGGRSKTVPVYTWDFPVYLDEQNKIIALSTANAIREEFAVIEMIVDELQDARGQVEQSNAEWEEIRERVRKYRDNYSTYVLRQDLY